MGQVYAPRTTQLAGSEAALRRLIAGLASNTPDYATMSPPLAEITRQQLPQLHAGVSQLGALQGMTFVEVDPRGGDVYNVAFAGGVRRFEVVLDADGKVVGAQALGPPVNPGS